MEKTPTLVDAPVSKYYPRNRVRPPIGRPKGSKDRWQQDAKWQIDEIFRLTGGVEAAAKWAKKHPSEFYPIYFRCRVPKPLELTDDDNNQITLIIQQGLPPAPPPLQLNTTTCSDEPAP